MSDQKDTIYIDIDDEITSIIDKVTSSNKKVVALVLPKRASVMQSIVNMRLLKRASDNAGKNLVLITSDSSVLPLAGVVGMYTAKTLQSRPVIPKSYKQADENQEIQDDTIDEVDLQNKDNLAGAAALGAVAGVSMNDDETIEVDNDQETTGSTSGSKTVNSKNPKKDKKLRIPNFDSFRIKLFLGIGILLLLSVTWFIAFKVMPKATITVKTNATTDPVEVSFVADPEVNEVDVQNGIVPAKSQKSEKTKTEKTPSTGEKNLGEKASGTVKMTATTNCETPKPTVPSGTTVSSSGANFITQETATFSLAPPQNGKCAFTSGDIDVIAAEGGGKFNLSARTYTVSGFNSIVAEGSNMTGGTDKIVKIVSQQDVDSAKNKALESNADEVKAEIKTELEKSGYTAIVETFNNSEPKISSTPAVGTEANEVSVTVVTAYTMLGAKTEDIKKVIDEKSKNTIDTENQTISDYGLSSATYKVSEVTPDGKAKITLNTTITTGTQLDVEKVKKDAAGKRRGEVQDQLKSIPGVIDVEVAYKPFWVTKTPSDTNKITIVVQNEGN